jgi:hypothetical protein
MSAKNQTKPEKETWRSWWPEEPADPEHLLTLEQLVARALEEGIVVSEALIRNRQHLGLLPRGVPYRVGRALQMRYPERYLDLLRDAEALQADGWRRAEIGPRLRVLHASTTHHAGQAAVFAPPTAMATATAHAPSIVTTINPPTATTTAAALPPIVVRDDIARLLRAIARDHVATYGGHVARAEVRLIDERGNHLTLGVDIY